MSRVSKFENPFLGHNELKVFVFVDFEVTDTEIKEQNLFFADFPISKNLL